MNDGETGQDAGGSNRDRFIQLRQRVEQSHAEMQPRPDVEAAKRTTATPRSFGRFLKGAASGLAVSAIAVVFVLSATEPRSPDPQPVDDQLSAAAQKTDTAQPEMAFNAGAEGSADPAETPATGTRDIRFVQQHRRVLKSKPAGAARGNSERGSILRHPEVLAATSAEISLSRIAVGQYATPIGSSRALIRQVPKNRTCQLAPPAPESMVAGVRLVTGLEDAPLDAITDRSLARQLLKSIREITGRRPDKIRQTDASRQFRMPRSGMSLVNVYVTETSRPVHLILQSETSILWNIHLADGARLEHAAILSPGPSAAVLPEDTPAGVEFLVGRHVQPDLRLNAETVFPDCMPFPYSLPDDTWLSVRAARKGSQLKQNFVATYRHFHTGYNAWYSKQIGKDANHNTLTAHAASHVLIGPVPEQPLAFRPLASQEIRIAEVDHVFAGSEAERLSQMQEFYREILSRAVGGPPALLKPEPVYREGS